jgi:hypothetical protein
MHTPDSIPSRHDLANPRTKRVLVGHSPNGTLIDDERGAFYFHEKVDGHGQGVVTRLWDLGEGEHDLDVISSDCRSHADAFAVVDEHLEELASMCVDFLADF